MSRRRIIEGRWTCSSCGTADISGRHKSCRDCGSPREAADGETDFDFGGTTATGASTEAGVADADALDTAEAGADWHCSACGAANRGDVGNCRACGAAPGETAAPEPTPDRPKGRGLKGLVVAGVLIAGVVFWVTRTQELQGEVARSWSHTVTQQRFTPLTTGGWQDKLRERPPEMPVEGAGGDGGVQKVRDCSRKQNGTRRVADGTERVCRNKTRKVQDGTREACEVRDLGNGFAEEVCTDTPVYKTESSEECADETRYREEPVFDTWCTYDTWAWKTLDEQTTSGTWDDPRWPVVKSGPLDRQQRTQAYEIVITYPWRSGSETHKVEPTSQKALEGWQEGVPVGLTVNNLGKVVELAR